MVEKQDAVEAEQAAPTTRWFRGQLEGNYVGTRAGRPALSQSGDATRYRMRIYRAVVRDIELLEGPDELVDDLHPEMPDGSFYQARIEDTRLLGIRPRSCFEGPIYDVAVDKMQVTHSTTKKGKTYGRVLGEVVGRYLMPPEAARKPEPVEERPLRPGDAEEQEGGAATEEKAVEDVLESGLYHEGERELEALHPPTAPSEDDREPPNIPVSLLVTVMALVLWLSAGRDPALLWLGFFIPILSIRLMMRGMFKTSDGQKVVGVIFFLIQLACLGAIGLEFWTEGCKSINVWAVSGVAAMVLASSVLPSPSALIATGGGLALVLFLWYSNFGTPCDPPEVAPKVEKAPSRPTVTDPGVPRTNEDGSWPRRPPR